VFALHPKPPDRLVVLLINRSDRVEHFKFPLFFNKFKDPTYVWPLFVELCVIFLAARFVSEYILTLLGQNAVRDLRLKLSRDILDLPFSALQKLGPGKVLANLTEDISAIAEAFVRIPSICVNFDYWVCYLSWMAIDGASLDRIMPDALWGVDLPRNSISGASSITSRAGA